MLTANDAVDLARIKNDTQAPVAMIYSNPEGLLVLFKPQDEHLYANLWTYVSRDGADVRTVGHGEYAKLVRTMRQVFPQ